MTRPCAWFVHGSVAAVGLTGIVYGWMRYFVEPEDEFAIANHPLEPSLQAWHLLSAPLLVFACGLLWRTHIWGRIRAGFRTRRRTGITLAGLLFPMIVSGYAVQVAVEESWRSAWIWIHGTTSSAWVLLYLWHQLVSPAELEDEREATPT